jgi:Rha family phage regulatory protein
MARSLACASAPTIAVIGGQPTTTSADVARHFGRRHRDVLRAIENLMADLPADDRVRNFAQTVETRPNPSGGTPIESPAYILTRDGFTLLAMGFTGKRALAFKLAYIEAFNRMEAAIAEATHTPERVNLAYAQASAVAEQAARAVFSAVMAGDDAAWRGARWLFTLSPATGAPQVQPVRGDQLLASMAELSRHVLEPGLSPSNAELAQLAAACSQSLARRIGQTAVTTK